MGPQCTTCVYNEIYWDCTERCLKIIEAFTLTKRTLLYLGSVSGGDALVQNKFSKLDDYLQIKKTNINHKLIKQLSQNLNLHNWSWLLMNAEGLSNMELEFSKPINVDNEL